MRVNFVFRKSKHENKHFYDVTRNKQFNNLDVL